MKLTFEEATIPCKNCSRDLVVFIPSNLVSGTIRFQCENCKAKGEIQYLVHTTSEGGEYDFMWMRRK